jgi:DNA-nicking Smr family endonuclease
MKKKKGKLFNPAFKDLPLRIRPSPNPPKVPCPTPPGTDKEPDEFNTFVEAMSGVKPLSCGKTRNIRKWGNHIKPSHPPPDNDKEAMDHLRRLVRGSVEMDITFSDEYVEGCVKGLNRKIMKKLKGGELPVQDYVDLHGLTKQGAEEEVKNFLLRSYKTGLRCVLIVHGRGLNSPDSFPVIKEGLSTWLGRGAVRKIVLAFATARPYDGGTGAIYVLLRKR